MNDSEKIEKIKNLFVKYHNGEIGGMNGIVDFCLEIEEIVNE